jgi:LemA protein
MTAEELVLHGPLVGLGVATLCLLGQYPSARRRKQLASMPICTTKGVFIGLVQLEGTVRCERPMTSYLAEVPVVAYRYSIAEHWQRWVTETYRDSEGNTRTRQRLETGWSSLAAEERLCPFELEDREGRIWVNSHGAHFDGLPLVETIATPMDPIYYGKGPAYSVPNSTFQRRFSESAIPVGDVIYLAGTARERAGTAELEIAQGERDPYFIVDTDGQHDVLRGLKWREWGMWTLAVAAIGIGAFFAHQNGAPTGLLIQETVGAGLAFLALWLSTFMIHVRNAYVAMRERVDQAESLVQVQLQRRHDLIPNLAEVTKAAGAYEAKVLTAMAEGRAVAGNLAILRERYPQLSANANFQKLQEELTDTEDRIAASRTYYLSAANLYRAMLERFPEGTIARLFGHRVPPRHLDPET